MRKTRLHAILDGGATVKLADGSLLRVDPFDLGEVRTWFPATEVELARTRDRVFDVTLTNRDTCAWIRAARVN